MGVDEGVDGLVGDEQQHLVERVVGVDVDPARQLAHPGPHVAHERHPVPVALAVGRRLEVAEVVVDGELHVHVQDPAAGQQEREVGDGARRRGRLLAVADALDQAGGPQHVVGHALAPLAPRRGVGQRLAQRLGGVGQAGAGRRHLGQAGLDPALLLGPLVLEAEPPARPPGPSSARTSPMCASTAALRSASSSVTVPRRSPTRWSNSSLAAGRARASRPRPGRPAARRPPPPPCRPRRAPPPRARHRRRPQPMAAASAVAGRRGRGRRRRDRGAAAPPPRPPRPTTMPTTSSAASMGANVTSAL